MKTYFQKPACLLIGCFLFSSITFSATFTVINTLDSGDGSLRWAIEQCNLMQGPDTVQFNIAESDTGFNGSYWTIRPQTNLPALYRPGTWINGFTQEENQGDRNADGPDIFIVGSDMPDGGIGILISSADNQVSGLVISGFKDYGIRIRNSDAVNNRIFGNYIGTDATGSSRLENTVGLFISLNAKKNIVGGTLKRERNVISGNYSTGLHITNADSNTIIGNYIGTDRTGTLAVNNGRDGKYGGVYLTNDSDYNVIGGADSTQRNIISGNGRDGIHISASDSNIVLGNYIGPDVTGQVCLGNGIMGAGDGMDIRIGATGNRIGGSGEGEGNVICGATNMGLRIWGDGTHFNVFQGNYIGTNKAGDTKFGNGNYGVYIYEGATENTIGGYLPGEGNLISGNTIHGILIENSGTENNYIIGNRIGIDGSGLLELGNEEYGVFINDRAKFNQIGPNNIISGNGGYGVHIYGAGTDSNVVKGNWIGLDITGQGVIPNHYDGFFISGDACYTQIGGPAPQDGNVISGNTWSGLRIRGDHLHGNRIEHNFIGTDTSGTQNLGNTFHGLHVYGDSNRVANNVISGNRKCGIVVSVISHQNKFIGNKIGVQSNGILPLPNDASGIRYDPQTESSGDTIGADNQIWYNGDYGIILQDTTVQRVTITRNSISGNGAGGISITNGANANIPAPIIVSGSPLSGTATPNATIEIFSDSLNQGRVYAGSAVADADGNWTYTGSMTGPHITATETDSAGNTSPFSTYFVMSSPVEDYVVAPAEFRLYQNYPNPFNPDTYIQFDVKKICHVRMALFNILGQKIETLIDEEYDTGNHQIHFNGAQLSSGIYFLQIQMGTFKKMKKMILSK